ncbi:hypothetical protein [uncultured Roseobacter sp.]|uniref:hypothetical protein n=1 Tax=uncultured Roseobacter sp. TaxID=114847 RepID=UPI00262BEF76|nr:hypothetical protein [uncultured Roseobacter sp.]
MKTPRGENAGEVSVSWFGKTLCKFTRRYIEMAFLASFFRLFWRLCRPRSCQWILILSYGGGCAQNSMRTQRIKAQMVGL